MGGALTACFDAAVTGELSPLSAAVKRGRVRHRSKYRNTTHTDTDTDTDMESNSDIILAEHQKLHHHALQGVTTPVLEVCHIV